MDRLCWLGILGVLVGLLISSSVVTASTHAAPLSEKQAMPDLPTSPATIQHQAGTDQCTDWPVIA